MFSVKLLQFLYVLLAMFSLSKAVGDKSGSESSDNDVVGQPEEKSGYASDEYGGGSGGGSGGRHRSQVYFGGQYEGRCGKDGFYYNDGYSFVTCSHGIAYTQRCAPGTRNGAMESYSSGGYYSHTSFCDVNLVDYGYAAYHSRRRPSNSGYGSHGSGYGSHGLGYGSHGSGYGSHGSGYGRNSGQGQTYGSSANNAYGSHGRHGSQGSGGHHGNYGQSYGNTYGRGYGHGQQTYGGYNNYGRDSHGYGQSSRGYGQQYRPSYH